MGVPSRCRRRDEGDATTVGALFAPDPVGPSLDRSTLRLYINALLHLRATNHEPPNFMSRYCYIFQQTMVSRRRQRASAHFRGTMMPRDDLRRSARAADPPCRGARLEVRPDDLLAGLLKEVVGAPGSPRRRDRDVVADTSQAAERRGDARHAATLAGLPRRSAGDAQPPVRLGDIGDCRRGAERSGAEDLFPRRRRGIDDTGALRHGEASHGLETASAESTIPPSARASQSRLDAAFRLIRCRDRRQHRVISGIGRAGPVLCAALSPEA